MLFMIMLAAFGAVTADGASAMRQMEKPNSPFEGVWRIEYPCGGATGVYAERCTAGEKDYLQFDLQAHGQALCGEVSASAQLGNSVDDGEPVSGSISGLHAHINWDVLGAAGDGDLEIHGSLLVLQPKHWKPDDGVMQSFPLSDRAVLRKVRKTHQVSIDCTITRH